MGDDVERLEAGAMSPKLPHNENQLMVLAEVAARRAPALKAVVDKVGREALAEEEREALREMLAAELCDRGLAANDEPNEYGHVLEHLIDYLGHVS